MSITASGMGRTGYDPMQQYNRNQANQGKTEGKALVKERAAQGKEGTPSATTETKALTDKADKVELGGQELSSVTYKPDWGEIQRLKAATEQRMAKLIETVRQLVESQGMRFMGLEKVQWDKIEVPDEVRAQAAADIADDGPFGAPKVADTIIQFAVAISGGDPEKVPLLRRAVEGGFNQAKRMLGELPEVSKRTHALIMEAFDEWEKTGQVPQRSENFKKP
ncbi:hypothetical protein [Heliorestis convoluta]|uniref:Uncharacterized protein n=1 Tax=Heliorestis convoluta TaxID=356322 RepID=A0A5Q2MY19_9FIRM|nr:hypothetical protein [Heliorestis convoluta]QGG47507.1 hypothetical protein FTV88_1360 [Heliorestis convoluta]